MAILQACSNVYQWWTPWANTVAYLPLKWNLNDLAWNYTWTSWANLQWDTTVANIPVAYITYDNWYAYTTTNWPTISWSNSYTISWWVKQTSATWAMCLLNTWLWQANYHNNIRFYKFYESNAYKWYYVMYLWWYSWTSGFEIWYNYNPWTNRHLWTLTYTPWSAKIYLDWSIVSTTSKTLSWTVTPEYPMGVGIAATDIHRSATAYYSDIIFESKARTADEISNYYNWTKSLYWIS